MSKQQLDTHEKLSHQDYGVWLDRVTLYEEGGKLLLKEEWGYSKPYDAAWYSLTEKPKGSLTDLCGNAELFCGVGDVYLLEELLEVTFTPTLAPDYELPATEVTITVQQESGYIAKTKNGRYVCILGERDDTAEGDTRRIFLPDDMQYHDTPHAAQTAYCNVLAIIRRLGAYAHTIPGKR